MLAQLTVVGEISKSQFEGKRQQKNAAPANVIWLSPPRFSVCLSAERFQLLQTKQPDYYIVVLEGVAFRKHVPLGIAAAADAAADIVLVT